ncbi:autotransporter outer membrane beta-barrel domain-containing protein [Parasutterella secunda]|uniref:autotransporter outer membrane beta-barrel domain-containing protein n=1 Tax=Parasutterella secunda TaxID=626947 RepID=UPI0025A3F4F9|nr:autotransporter outer membrane beta-barrel domain-containing protein [Parasutterella secunda]MDM8218187.1 autotransporter outer membrane beta-barrel domain-containing protein [Parasutterella secunda]
MHLNKTILASSILMAISASSLAVEIPVWAPEGKVETVETPHQYKEFDADYYVKTNSDSTGDGFNSGDAIFDQKLWIEQVSSQHRAFGLLAGKGQTAKNAENGLIYVKGTTEGFWKVKAMMAQNGGTIVNKGTIVADNAYGMMITNTDGNKLENNGTIIVLNNGVAMDFAGNKDGSNVTSGSVINTGDLIVQGDGDLKAIRIAEGATGVKFTNKGLISATGSQAKAISVENGGVIVTLTEGSQVNGLVDLYEDTALNVTKLNSAQTISLNDYAGEVKVTESNVTFEQGSDNALKIGSVETDKGSASFKLNAAGNKDNPVLTIGTVGDGSNVNYGYTASVSDDLQAGNVVASDLLNGIQINSGESAKLASVDQGLMGDAGYVDKNGFHVTRTNDLLRSAQDLAITNALMWRSQLTNLTDRMGTLRTTPDAAGVWARYNNGRLDGQGIQHDYNTVELGVDKRIADNVTIGFSFDYTKGDTDLSAGSSDNNTYTVGFYGSYFNESGCFLDTMLKIGRIDADYDFRTSAGKESADYMLTGAIFGIETGHRWNIQNYFIEPQVQLTYSHLRAENYTSSIGRDVKFDDMSSLIGRVGVMAGMQFAENRGSAYVKASYNHDFLGDVEGNYEFNGSVRTFDDELDDNWGEVSLGASYQVTDSVNTFVDVGTGFGGDIDQKWRVNLGARYVF